MSSKKYTKNQLIQIAKKNNISLKNRENKMKTKEQLFGSLNRKKLLKGGMSNDFKIELKKFLIIIKQKIEDDFNKGSNYDWGKYIKQEVDKTFFNNPKSKYKNERPTKKEVFNITIEILKEKENTNGYSLNNNLKNVTEKQIDIITDIRSDKLNPPKIIDTTSLKSNIILKNIKPNSNVNNNAKSHNKKPNEEIVSNNKSTKEIEFSKKYNIIDIDFNIGPLSFISLSIIYGKLDNVLEIKNIKDILTKQYPIVKGMSLNSIGYCIFTNDDVNLNKILAKFYNEKLVAAKLDDKEKEVIEQGALDFALNKYYDYKEEWKTKKNKDGQKSDKNLTNLKKSYNIVMDLYNYYKYHNMTDFCKSYLLMSKTINESFSATSTRSKYTFGTLKKNTNENREKLNKITDIIIGKATNRIKIQSGGFFKKAICVIGYFIIDIIFALLIVSIFFLTAGEGAYEIPFMSFDYSTTFSECISQKKNNTNAKSNVKKQSSNVHNNREKGELRKPLIGFNNN